MTESTNEAFHDYTRSTAFSMSLSSKMVRTLLDYHAKVESHRIGLDLATRYDWYQPFGNCLPIFSNESPEQIATRAGSSERALLRRGLLEIGTTVIDPEPSPSEFVDLGPDPAITVNHLRLSRAGELAAMLMIEAGFTPVRWYVKPVKLHPDDRIQIDWSDTNAEAHFPADRRLELMVPGDEQWLDSLSMNREVSA